MGGRPGSCKKTHEAQGRWATVSSEYTIGTADMKWILILLLLIIPFSSYALEVGDNAPEFKILPLGCEQLSYDKDNKDKKPVYLIFWATWWTHCKKELPVWKKLHEELGNKIEFIGINIGINQEIEEVQALAG